MKSLLASFFQAFTYTFLRAAAYVAAFVCIIAIAGKILSSDVQRKTMTEVLPNHLWETPSFSTHTPTILRIPIEGVIGADITKQKVHAILQEISTLKLEHGALKAIILNINSPGGSADDSQAILQMLLSYKKRFHLPVYAFVDGLSASGGVMVSLAADTIIASEGSLVGHVGAISSTRFNVSKAMETCGIAAKTLHAGTHKDELNPFRTWTQDEGACIQRILDASYEQFITLVVAHRPRVSEEKLRDEGALLFFPEEALSRGYIDMVQPSYSEALQHISATLDLSTYQVVQLTPLEGNAGLTIQHVVRTSGGLASQLSGSLAYMAGP